MRLFNMPSRRPRASLLRRLRQRSRSAFKKTSPQPLPSSLRDYSYSMNDDATAEIIALFRSDEHMISLVDALKMTDPSQFESLCRYMWINSTPGGQDLSAVDWAKVSAVVGHTFK